MQARPVVALALAAALSGCGGQRVPTAQHLPPDVAKAPTSPGLLRVARAGGTAEMLNPGTLAPRQWIISSGLPTISHILGASGIEDQTVYVTDNAGRLVAIDLQARRTRLIPTSARQLVGAPDGVILGIDSAHHPVRFANRAVSTLKASVDRGVTLLRGPGEQIVAAGARPGVLQVLGGSGEIRRLNAPNGRVTATWVGDYLAVTTDSGVALIDPAGPPVGKKVKKALTPFVKIPGSPVVATFSPSGHRLYVARKKGGLVVVDRFTHTVLRQAEVAGPADGLRVDRSGRWLLAHNSASDSLWVIDVSSWSVVDRRTAPWAEDLPQVVDAQVLLIRRKNDLVAVDLSGATPQERGVLAGGAGDLYVMLPWVPKVAPSEPGATVAAGTPVANPATPETQPSAAAPAVTPPAGQHPGGGAPEATHPPGTVTVYIQVSSSQNEEWAKASAKQLKEGGYPAKVLDPKTSDEGYRVVIGPYTSREDADAVGKRLGRPYFLITPGSGDT